MKEHEEPSELTDPSAGGASSEAATARQSFAKSLGVSADLEGAGAYERAVVGDALAAEARLRAQSALLGDPERRLTPVLTDRAPGWVRPVNAVSEYAPPVAQAVELAGRAAELAGVELQLPDLTGPADAVRRQAGDLVLGTMAVWRQQRRGEDPFAHTSGGETTSPVDDPDRRRWTRLRKTRE